METTPTYVKQITVEEYNKQKDETTQKALKELNEQIKSFKNTNTNTKTNTTNINRNRKLSISLPNSDNDEDVQENNSDSDYTENTENPAVNPSVNFIIKHYVSEQTPPQQQLLKKRKITNTNQSSNQSKTNGNDKTNGNINTMSDAIYAQHELDMETITNLKLQNNNLQNETNDLDKKTHFLTLELSNAQCDIGEFKKQISYLKDENIKLKQFIKIMIKNDDQFELYIKFICYIFISSAILLTYIYIL
jgi:hypothetical protein